MHCAPCGVSSLHWLKRLGLLDDGGLARWYDSSDDGVKILHDIKTNTASQQNQKIVNNKREQEEVVCLE